MSREPVEQAIERIWRESGREGPVDWDMPLVAFAALVARREQPRSPYFDDEEVRICARLLGGVSGESAQALLGRLDTAGVCNVIRGLRARYRGAGEVLLREALRGLT